MKNYKKKSKIKMPTNQIQDSGVVYVWGRCQHTTIPVLRQYL